MVSVDISNYNNLLLHSDLHLVIIFYSDQLGPGHHQTGLAVLHLVLLLLTAEVSVRHHHHHQLVRLDGLEHLHQQPLHQGGDHRQVQEVSRQGWAGRRHEDLCQAGRSQCRNGALLLLLVFISSELAS